LLKKKFEKNITAGLKHLAGRTPPKTADTWRLGWKAWELGKQHALTLAPGCCHLVVVLAENLACKHKRKSIVFFFLYYLPMPMSLGWIAYTVAIWSHTSRTQHPPKVLSLAVQPYSRILRQTSWVTSTVESSWQQDPIILDPPSIKTQLKLNLIGPIRIGSCTQPLGLDLIA